MTHCGVIPLIVVSCKAGPARATSADGALKGKAMLHVPLTFLMNETEQM
jgi:hypothetical protein